ncbi:hypothetical protein PND92_10195 [Faecalicoccus pleomorphus]|uniref:hypothetical protein n=1 Tax=Faecalicoccus pleomorphus TaxID=1323 RepID=UPI00232F884E|nr:hypothetical protein [Faecalicoccus pleomorphus]MDB7988199.1 hypothetical protein [Faecalicoccus pleomorphus]MDB7994132.1 hypothetical protein [Faecalicoccus pleomorphus]
MRFCSISLSVLSYARSKFSSSLIRERLEIIACTFLLVGLIFLVGTFGISMSAVLASSLFICLVALVFQFLI